MANSFGGNSITKPGEYRRIIMRLPKKYSDLFREIRFYREDTPTTKIATDRLSDIVETIEIEPKPELVPIAVYLSKRLDAAIKKRIEETGRTATDILVAAIEIYTSDNSDTYVKPNHYEELRQSAKNSADIAVEQIMLDKGVDRKEAKKLYYRR